MALGLRIELRVALRPYNFESLRAYGVMSYFVQLFNYQHI